MHSESIAMRGILVENFNRHLCILQADKLQYLMPEFQALVRWFPDDTCSMRLVITAGELT
ncbi:MAG: hypothetical protein N3G20_08015 [Verrucomicrobiae bacterium]|nr:hypothetical protein [Verrucomicrobiae bacterium]